MAYARESTYSDLKQEEFDPYQLYEKPVPPRNFGLVKRPLLSHLLGWPALVVLGQLLLQAVGWGFLAAVRSRGEVALPLHMALSANENPHIVTFVATLISTVLAGCSSFLFSYALRKSMSLYLLRPVSLAALGAGVNISMRSLVFHRRHWKWPAVSLLCLIMAGVQTSAWSTLITPVHIVLSTPLVGRDLDLLSPTLQRLWDSDDSVNFCALESLVDNAGIAGLLDSSSAKVQSYLGLPGVVSLFGQSFNASTHGILPATLNNDSALSLLSSTLAQSIGPRHRGISGSYSMTQQGFTASVSCSPQNLTKTTSPPVELANFSSPTNAVWGESLEAGVSIPNITYVVTSATCAGGPFEVNNTQFFVSSEGGHGYMWAIGCYPTPDVSNYTLILQGSEDYTDITSQWFTVCQIAPATSVVRVDYADDAAGISGTLESLGPPLADASGFAGGFPMNIFYALVFTQQSPLGNGLGDQLLRLLKIPGAHHPAAIVEQYVQGAWEYSGTALRQCLGEHFGPVLPTNISVPNNGTWTTQTLGWKRFSTGTTLWIVIPGLFMACSTVALVLVAVYRHGGEMQTHTTTFDPSDPLHLIAAAAAGGLNNVFRSLRNKDIDEGGKTKVVLGSVPGRGPALVRADEYAPLSAATPLTPIAALPLAHALIIVLPSTSITVGNFTITYQSEAADPTGNLTFYISHLGGVGGYLTLQGDVPPHTTPTKLQLSLFDDDGDGQQWAVAAGPSTQSVDGIFAVSDPLLILPASSSSASASASATAPVQSSVTPSSSGASSPPTSPSSSVPTDTSVSSNATPSPSASAVVSPPKSSPSVGLIVGVTSVIALLLILLLFAFLLVRKRRRRRNARMELDPEPAFLSHAAFASAQGSSSNASFAPKVEPFMSTAESSVSPTSTSAPTALSSKAAQARQEYLLNQMREVQWQLQALQGRGTSSAAPPTSAPSSSGVVSPSASESALSGTTDGSGLAQARQQNEALQERIRALEQQLQSQWALGLSDEPPPGYLE
ncbi:hypothetical protein DFH06DRAFT_1345817 [Mycena polygramma]|nr:hypothetical protein DFH06DRAFT_1345817 [Mycena polygramma]